MTIPHVLDDSTSAIIAAEDEHVAHNYHPLPVVISKGEGAWVTDVEGKRYLDLLAAYSALNFGHGHPAILAAAQEQLGRLTLTSRAYHNDQLGVFAAALAELCGKDLVLPMNTGAEAVETGIKVARAWGYRVKGIAPDRANDHRRVGGNFHGRTTTIVGFSDDPQSRDDFGPYAPGFVTVPFGDAAAIEAAIDENTAAVLLEPIQGEAGVVIPPEGYLRAGARDHAAPQRAVHRRRDPVRPRPGRRDVRVRPRGRRARTCTCSARRWAAASCPCRPSWRTATCSGVIRPGEHGSTFGGNPLAAAVGTRVVEMLSTGEFQRRAAALGEHLEAKLDELVGHGVTAVRIAGLWAGVDIDPAKGTGREIAERLLGRGVLVKDTHGQTIRIAPPLVIRATELDWAVEQLKLVLAD